MTVERHQIDLLRERVYELDRAVQELDEEVERMYRDQTSIVFLCAVATTLCMVFCIALLVLS